MLFMRERGKYDSTLANSPAKLGMVATSTTQQAAEYHHGGIFTTQLLDVLEGDNKFIRNEMSNNLLTAHELFSKVARKTSEKAWDDFEHTQTPQFGTLQSTDKNGQKCEGSMLFQRHV